MKAADPHTRASAVFVLGSRGPENVPELIESLDDLNEGVKYLSIISLLHVDTLAAREGLKKALPFLEQGLHSDNVKRKETASEFLTWIGTPEALKTLNDK